MESTMDLGTTGKVTNKVSIVDYFTFGSMLLLSVLVGVYYFIFDRKSQSSTQGYFFGGKSLHPLPVAFSLMASFISSPIMLGGPAEVYTQGTMIYWLEFSIIFALLIASFTFIPLLLGLNVNSIYEV